MRKSAGGSTASKEASQSKRLLITSLARRQDSLDLEESHNTRSRSGQKSLPPSRALTSLSGLKRRLRRRNANTGKRSGPASKRLRKRRQRSQRKTRIQRSLIRRKASRIKLTRRSLLIKVGKGSRRLLSLITKGVAEEAEEGETTTSPPTRRI